MCTMPTYGGARPRATGRWEAGRWEDLGANATIAATTVPPVSRMIAQLQPYDDRVFLGYGEWSVNLPNCDLIAWNVATGRYETILPGVATAAFWSLRVVDGRLWALATDPVVGTNPDAVIYDGVEARLLESGQVGPWHLFDVRAWSGALFLAGAHSADGAASHGAVWRSLNNGATWEIVLELRENPRIYGLLPLEETLIAAAMNGQAWRTVDGDRWRVTSLDLLPGESEVIRPQRVGGRVAYLSGWPALGPQSLYAFDGEQVERIGDAWSFRDAYGDDEQLVVLTAEGEVRASRNLATWERLAGDAPETACSVCLLDGAIYAGTTDSRLWRYRA